MHCFQYNESNFTKSIFQSEQYGCHNKSQRSNLYAQKKEPETSSSKREEVKNVWLYASGKNEENLNLPLHLMFHLWPYLTKQFI